MDKEQVANLRLLYARGASYKYIAGQICASEKQVDNYVYKHGLSKEFGRRVGERGGETDKITLAPVHRLRKDEIVWLSKNFCKKHGMPYLSHYDCYLEENPNSCRVGFFDIECNDLNPAYGVLLSYAILDCKTNEIKGRHITKGEVLSDDLDKKIVEECVNDLCSYDVLVTYFGTKFDIPYIRTRATTQNIKFPSYGSIKTIDLYYVVKSKFKIGRRSLENACRFIVGETRKTEILPHILPRCVQGREEALAYLWEHNIYDVLDTRDLYNKVVDFRYPTLRSI